MTCQARVDGKTCRQEWCWICGGKLSNVSRHYNPMNPFGCPGAQMNGRGEWINENSYCRCEGLRGAAAVSFACLSTTMPPLLLLCCWVAAPV